MRLPQNLSPRPAFAALGIPLACAALLSACGGDVGDARPSHSTPPVTSAAVGLYLGYYQESTTDDTADPVAGALVVNVPAAASGSAVTGSIDYNSQACQTGNVLPLTGTRSDLGLIGTFAGNIDTAARTGTFAASLDTTALNFTGTYGVDGGKQAVVAAGTCAAYTLAGAGTIELFPVAKAYPSSDFSVSYTPATRTIAWSQFTAAAKALVYLVDNGLATATTGNANPVPWQVLIDPSGSTLSVVVPSTVTLVSGRQYYAVVQLANSSRARIAFSSTLFTAP